MDSWISPFLQQAGQWAPLLESLLLSVALVLLATPVGALLGWLLATRRVARLPRWVLWGALWSVVLVPLSMVAEAFPPEWVRLLGERLSALFLLLFFSLPWIIFYAIRLFAVVGTVTREARYQMGLVEGIPAMVVRPLLWRLLGWSSGVALLVVQFGEAVAERFGIETLAVALYSWDQAQLSWLFWVAMGWMALAMVLLLHGYRSLPSVDPQQVEHERVRMGGGAQLILMLGMVMWLPLGMVLGQMIHG